MCQKRESTACELVCWLTLAGIAFAGIKEVIGFLPKIYLHPVKDVAAAAEPEPPPVVTNPDPPVIQSDRPTSGKINQSANPIQPTQVFLADEAPPPVADESWATIPPTPVTIDPPKVESHFQPNQHWPAQKPRFQQVAHPIFFVLDMKSQHRHHHRHKKFAKQKHVILK